MGNSLLGLGLLGFLPWISGPHYLTTLNHMGILIVAAHGLNILIGYTGQISIGHSAFMAVGAYTTGILATHAGWPFWATIPLAGLSAGVVGTIFGLPSLKLKGFYLAMATLAAQFIIPWLIDHVRVDITGGVFSLDVPPPNLVGVALNSQLKMFYLIMSVAAL